MFVVKVLRKFRSLIENIYEKDKKSRCVCDICFYPESKVTNLQERTRLYALKGTHVRVDVYPYGDGISIGDNCYVEEYSVICSGNGICYSRQCPYRSSSHTVSGIVA